MGNECSRIPSVRMAPTERFWCAEHSGYPELYKEDICICLCRVYVISYRVCPLRFAQRHSFGVVLRMLLKLVVSILNYVTVWTRPILQSFLWVCIASNSKRAAAWQWRIEGYLSSSRVGHSTIYPSSPPNPPLFVSRGPESSRFTQIALITLSSTNTGFFGTVPCVGSYLIWFMYKEFIYLNKTTTSVII